MILSLSLFLAFAVFWVNYLMSLVQRYFGRTGPPNKFHIFQPWTIPDRTTGSGLLFLAGFDALLCLPVYLVFAASMGLSRALPATFLGAVVAVMSLSTVTERYWCMRRQYRSVRNSGLLSYIKPSPLIRRERWRWSAIVFQTVSLALILAETSTAFIENLIIEIED